MSILERIARAAGDPEELKRRLFNFLKGPDAVLRLSEETSLSREEAGWLLQELFPTGIEVRSVCSRRIPVVVAAPHVSFDSWSEYFCNRTARALKTGWVVAKNFRDEDLHSIPVSIGRHLHVNRPTESRRRRGAERVTERAQAAHREYVDALRTASGGELPLALLIEYHSQHRSTKLEIATTGVGTETAGFVADRYEALRQQSEGLPELRIEPLHPVSMKAESAKSLGVFRKEITRAGMHIEIPREARRSEASRALLCGALITGLDAFITLMEGDAHNSGDM